MPIKKIEKVIQEALRERFLSPANAENAAAMQAYMKSSMPFYGVKADLMRSTAKEVFAEHPFEDADTFQNVALFLWRNAQKREERYAAIEFTGLRAAKAFQTPSILPMYDEMIVTGAWWDYVDVLAIHRMGPLLLLEPKSMKKKMLHFSTDRDMWRRRTAILCQVAAKKKTDVGLLYQTIEPNLNDKEFFIRKAIGWALREYGKTDPKEVSRYVAENESKLSNLSKREALKRIEKGH